MIYKKLEEIKEMIKNNETELGEINIDELRVIIALDFCKTEIQKEIKKAKDIAS